MNVYSMIFYPQTTFFYIFPCLISIIRVP